MARLGIDVAGLTETQIVDSGRTEVEDSLLLHSGGTTHTHGVALMLRQKSRRKHSNHGYLSHLGSWPLA